MSEEGHKVVLNVYDLSQGLARQLSTTFLGKVIEGIWHTGIVVYGNEYYFGGGIQNSPAGTTPYGTPIKVVDLGVTHVPKDMFEMYLQEISPRYTAETYSLMTHNCNNFSNEVAQFLVDNTIPDYILQLPNEVMSSPMGALIMPMIQNLETTLRAGAVPQTPQFRPTPVSQPIANVARSSASTQTKLSIGENTARKANEKLKSEGSSKAAEKSVAQPRSTGNGVADPLGSARIKVQEEIAAEFAAIMATGTFRASEAAAIATKRVMQKHGSVSTAMPQS